MSFGVLVVPLGALCAPWGDLGRHFGVRSSQKRLKKKASGACCIPESVLRVKSNVSGHAKCDENMVNTNVFARCSVLSNSIQKDAQESEKVRF